MHTTILAILLLPACGSVPTPECGEAALEEESMRAELSWLASPELDGRAPGTEGDAAAREFLADRFACLGLSSFFDSFQQPFVDSEGNETANVIGFQPGDDLSEEIVLLSAHLDHLGDGYLGANDNASGLSGLLSIAQAITEGEATRRTVVFAAFGAEESGFEGSEYFYTHPPAELDPEAIVYNVNMDMIGSYDQTGIVYALGALSGTPARTLLENLTQDYPEIEVGLDEPSDQSDNFTFCSRGIRYVFMWTEDPECYHERCDRADRIDYPGLVSITSLTLDLVSELADTETDLFASRRSGRNVCGL